MSSFQTITPTRAFFRPGDSVEIPVPGAFRATIWHLAEPVAHLQGNDLLRWQPPATALRGYRVQITTETGDYWTAFDVLNRWTDAPRYGFLFDFHPARQDFDLSWLLAHHINGIQFYDWQYRHETLLPPAPEYTDPLGRELSLNTVQRLITQAHEYGMVAMPYTAIYGASPAFAAAHATWGLYDERSDLYDFADGFLKIMNPDSPWRTHFIKECALLLDALPFDGIHVDQYGEPQTGFSSAGQPVNLPQAFAASLQGLRANIGPERGLLFNLVHNWPLDAIAPAPVDFLYCELWPPQTRLGDVATITALNRAASGGKVPVVAVYVDPDHETTVRLLQSVILASGGYHLAHGEQGLYLCDPYFPLSRKPSLELAAHLKRLADFAVAYGELLSWAELYDVEATVSQHDLWMVARRSGETRLVLNLLNASPQQQWNTAIPVPRPGQGVTVRLKVEFRPARVWYVSPDVEAPPNQVPFEVHDGLVVFEIPAVTTWTLCCVEGA